MLGNNCKLFLYGLPPDCEENSLKDYLEAVCGVSDGVIKVSIPPGKTFGFVTLQRADIAESFLEMTLLYCDGSGEFYQVKPCRYIERQYTQRPRKSNPLENKCNYTKSAACQVPRRCNEPTKYKSPEHVHFSPDYNMLGLSLPKKRKRKHNDGVVWFGDCGTTTKKKPTTKRKKLKKKASKLVIHKGESFQLGLVAPVQKSTESEVDVGNTKTTAVVDDPLPTNKVLSDKEAKPLVEEVADIATESLSTKRHDCAHYSDSGPERKSALSDSDAGTTKTTTAVGDPLTTKKLLSNEDEHLKLSMTEVSTKAAEYVRGIERCDNTDCSNEFQSASHQHGLAISGNKETPLEVGVEGTNSTTVADVPVVTSSNAEVKLPAVDVPVKAAKLLNTVMCSGRSPTQVIIEHGLLGPLCFEISDRTSVGDVKDEIMARTGLPIGNQTLYFNHKKLFDNLVVQLLPTDGQNSVTLVLFEGCLKGGVREGEGAVGGVKDPMVTQECETLPLMEMWTADQTASWMSKEGLPQKYANVCKEEEISGRALLILGEKPEQLKACFKIKEGPLINLLDSLKPHLERFDRSKLQMVLESDTSLKACTMEELCRLLRELRMPEECLECVEEEEIDGRAFTLMRSSNRLQDFLRLKIGSWAVLDHEMALREDMGDKSEENSKKEDVATRSKQYLQEPTADNPDVESDKPTQDDSDWRLDYKTPLAANSPFTRSTMETQQKPDLSKDKDMLQCLQGALKLNIKATGNAQGEQCAVRSMYVKRGGGANALEKMLNVIVITKGGSSQLSADVPRRLWEMIRKCTSEWMKLFLEKDSKLFLSEDGCIMSVHDKKEVSLRDGKVGQIFLEKLSADEFENSYFVVLIDERFHKKRGDFSFYIDKKEKRSFTVKLGDKESKYHASFDTGNPAQGLKWSKHFKSLIKQSPMNTSVLKSNEKKLPSACDPQSAFSTQTPRVFNSEVGNKTYTQGFILDCLETGPKDLICPVHELKLFRRGVEMLGEEQNIRKFVYETLRFACGCLNERTNGTIHFGVVDELETQAQASQPREIVGFPVTSKPFYNEKLTEFIDKCFVGDSKSIVHNCVRPPVFVPVKPSSSHLPSNEVVIEVDVEPSYSLCENEIFKAQFKALERGKKEAVAYMRHGSETQEMDADHLEDYLNIRRSKLDEQRKMRERETYPKLLGKQESTRCLFVKLQRLLCANKKVLDSAIYPILVMSKPSMKQEVLEENFSFISSISWQTILDFDAQGSKDSGLCKVFKSGANAPECDIHEAEDFDQDDDIIESLYYKTHWIFGNGYAELGKEAVSFKQWNNSKRKRGISQVIQSLASKLPEGRAVVLFLLLSKDYQAMADTFKDFCTYLNGPNQLLYVAENMEIATDWEAELSRTCLEEHQLRERGVVGMSWGEFQECFQQMVCGLDREKCYVSMATGSLYPLKNISFSNLDIVSAKECEELASLEPVEREDISTKEEEKFYRGCPVTWKNFWFTDSGKNHVLRRDSYADLKSLIETMFHSGAEKKVQTITLYHHVGAGASTMGRQALWDFRYNQKYPYRCALITKIDDNTCLELLKLRRIGYNDEMEVSCPPVLALVEDTDDFLFKELRQQVEESASNLRNTNSPICVFLYCKDTVDPYVCHRKESATSVYLMQHLVPNEVQWFEDKYIKMERKFHKKDPGNDFKKYASENLISFMIMKENFNPDYAQSVVERNLSQVTNDELTLLEYTSLLSIYDPYPVFASCFDSIMVSFGLLRRKIFRDWVEELTHSARIFLRDVDCSTHTGTGKAIAIVHPIIASQLLDQIAARKSLTVGQIALKFLRSPLLENKTSYSFTTKYLRDRARIMLKHRKKYQYGDNVQTKFSPLIEKILCVAENGATEQSIYEAAEVLKEGLEKFDDPMLAQQIARVFYVNVSAFSESNIDSCFEKAFEFCNKAIEMNPNNSFLFDTMGRIQESKMKVLYGEVRKGNKEIDIERVNELLPLAFATISWFQKSQAASVDDHYNTSGFHGEIWVMFFLLDVLHCVTMFRGKQGLKKLQLYLAVSQVIPQEVETCWESFHQSFKGLRNRFIYCMEEIAEEFTIYKDGERAKTAPKQIAYFKAQYHSYFGEDEVKLDTPEEQWEYGWQRINQYLGGDIFSSVFSIHRAETKLEVTDPKETLRLLRNIALENFQVPTYKETYKDLLLIVTTSMALHSPYGLRLKSPRPTEIEEYTETYSYVDKLCTLEERDGRKQLYAHLFKLMFLWPRTDLELQGDNRVQDFYDALVKINKKWKEKGPGNIDTDVMLKQNIYKNMSFKSVTRQYTTLFYLGKGTGLDVFVHANELSQPSNELSQTTKGKQSLNWEHPKTKGRLRRLTGVVASRNIIKVQNALDSSRDIDVYYSSSRLGGFSKEKVSFYLGFSWRRPVAFDVQYANARPLEKHHNEDPALDSHMNFDLPKYPLVTYDQYISTMGKLTTKIEEIEFLKKRQLKGEKLDANQENKMKKEEECRKKLQDMQNSCAACDEDEIFD